MLSEVLAAGEGLALRGDRAYPPSMTPRQLRIVMVVLIASGGPMMLLLDLLLRGVVLAEQPEDVRVMAGELATNFAWYVVPCPALGGLAGFFLYPKLYAYQLARASPGDPEKARNNADLTAMMVTASLPQLPALLGDLSVLMGGQITPVLYSTSISTVAVLLITLVAPRVLASRGLS